MMARQTNNLAKLVPLLSCFAFCTLDAKGKLAVDVGLRVTSLGGPGMNSDEIIALDRTDGFFGATYLAPGNG
jgi:hypothetical protein